ncbi:MAG: hypothetical protein U0929_09045 [Planctomycetaceae bacterium]
MVRSMPWKLALLSVGAVTGFASLATQSFADDSEGIVRISDHGTVGQGSPAPVADNGGFSGGYVEGGCPNCQQGAACGYHGCNMRPMGYVNHILGWVNPWSGVGTYSPDHGYAPPGKVRTPHPQQVAYNKAFPDAWTGQPGAGGGGQRAYQIYMPTDTTQLGYYYQAAPRWHANPAMIPPTPVPSQWHRDLCQGQGCQNGRCQLGARLHHHGRGQNCPPQYGGEQIISEQVINSQPETANPTPIQESAPTEATHDPSAPTIPAPIQNVPGQPAPATTTPMTPPAAPLEKASYPNLRPIR